MTRIRLVRDGDVDALVAIYRPVVLETMISFETTPPDAHEMARRVAANTVSHPWLVCEFDGEVAGYAYATTHRARPAYRWSVEPSVYVAEGHRRRSVGRGLYESLFAVLSAQGYMNAYAGISLPNPASVALHEAMGFRAIGTFPDVGYKLGRWWDVGWWHRPLQPSGGGPTAPTDLVETMSRGDWESLVRRGEAFVRGPA